MHVYDLALGGYVFMEVDMQIYPKNSPWAGNLQIIDTDAHL